MYVNKKIKKKLHKNTLILKSESNLMQIMKFNQRNAFLLKKKIRIRKKGLVDCKKKSFLQARAITFFSKLLF